MDEIVSVTPWTPLAYKQTMANPERHGPHRHWFPDPTDAERIASYYTLSLYLSNAARAMLPDVEARPSHREYGDPTLLRDRIVAGVLGADWAVTVDGAGDDLADGPSIPAPPAEPGEDATEVDRRVYNARLDAWHASVDETITEWETLVQEQPRNRQAQKDLRDWWNRRQAAARLVEATQTEVGLGDSVVVLWPQAGDWPKLSVVQPDGYFPVVSDDDAADYPDRVDIAWDFLVEEPDGSTEVYVRRMTWQLTPITTLRSGVTRDGDAVWVDSDGAEASTPILGANEAIVETPGGGVVVRTLPWHGDDGYTTTTCLFSEGVWLRRDLTKEKLRDFPEHLARWDHYNTDLGFDFIPVIHTPNTPASQEVWGRSSLANISQILDDIATSDKDAMQASRYLSDPTIFAKGVTTNIGDQVMPGMLMKAGGESAGMDVLDLSAGVPELLAAGDRLQDRLWQVAGMPAELVGRIDESNSAVSGVALMLRFAPFAQMVGILRMAREPKHQLILKFAYRMAQVAGAIEPGPTPSARIAYGSFLPTNRAETVQMVSQAVQAHVMSTQTAVLMLVAAGFPVDDAKDEVGRIRRENTAAAKDLADAVQSEQAAADYLGIDLPQRPFLPEIDLGG